MALRQPRIVAHDISCRPPCPLEQLSCVFARIGQFEDKPRIAVACSGGGDSLALLLLCREWWLKIYAKTSAKRATYPSTKTGTEECRGHVVALICDHAMRAESKSECLKLKKLIDQQFNLSAHILSAQPFVAMRGNKQENMRNFRITACQEWCRANGVIHLAFGHTQDDQVETFLLQQANMVRGSGAMQELHYARHVRIIRPLLRITRKALRDWLVARNVAWLEDPSNQSNRYARNRLRRALGTGKNADACTEPCINACDQVRNANSASDEILQPFTAQYVTLYAEGYARIESREFLNLQKQHAQRLVSSLAHRVGGRHARTTQLNHALPLWQKKLTVFLLANSLETNAPITSNTTSEQRAGVESKPPTLSLGRVLLTTNAVRQQAEHAFFIVRAQLAPEEITLDKELQNYLWDGRYKLLPPLIAKAGNSLQLANLTCRALGREGIEQLRAAAKNNASKADNNVTQAMEIFESLPARVRVACPAFWQKKQLRALPTLKLYRNIPLACSSSHARGKVACWLSTKEIVHLPRIRWENVKQQNLQKNAILNPTTTLEK